MNPIRSFRMWLYKANLWYSMDKLPSDYTSFLVENDISDDFIAVYRLPNSIIPQLRSYFYLLDHGLIIKRTDFDDGRFIHFEDVTEIEQSNMYVTLNVDGERDVSITILTETGEEFKNTIKKTFDRYLQMEDV